MLASGDRILQRLCDRPGTRPAEAEALRAHLEASKKLRADLAKLADKLKPNPGLAMWNKGMKEAMAECKADYKISGRPYL